MRHNPHTVDANLTDVYARLTCSLACPLGFEVSVSH